MSGLLKKDIFLLKSQRNFLAIIIVVAAAVGYNSGGSFAAAYLTFLSMFLVLNSFGYDDNGGCVAFLLTLPVSRSGYVREKYAFGMLLTAVGFVVGELIDVGMGLVRGDAPHFADILSDLMLLPGFWMFLAVLIPILIKYGVERGRMCIFIVLVFIAGAGYFGEKLLDSAGVDVQALAGRLLQNGQPFLFACALPATLAVLALSCGISVRIMKRKEF